MEKRETEKEREREMERLRENARESRPESTFVTDVCMHFEVILIAL